MKTMTENLPAAFEDELALEPWLRPHVRARDVDLEAARERFAAEQLEACRELRRSNTTVGMRLHHGVLLTTALDLEKKR